MPLINKNIQEFINEVDNNQPTPGGGSVSALIGSLGASLASMFGKLSVNKKAFAALDEKVRNDFIANLNELQMIKKELLDLVDHDTNMYNELLVAYKLAKTTEEEINVRNRAIYQATVNVTSSPLKMMITAYEGLKVATKLIDYGNKNALSDIGVGIICLFGTINGAYLNVKINLSGLNEEDAKFYKIQSDLIKDESTTIYNELMKKI
jgi:formiminotetrahydrofolate cyclodeaminase